MEAIAVFGAIAQISIVRLFLGGAIPGLIVGVVLMVLSYVYAKRRNYPVGRGTSFREFVSVSRKTIWALVLPLIILGGILSGLFTATEACSPRPRPVHSRRCMRWSSPGSYTNWSGDAIPLFFVKRRSTRGS